MKALIVTISTLLLLGTGCESRDERARPVTAPDAVRTSPPSDPSSSPRPAAEASSPRSGSPATTVRTLEVWFTYREHLFVTQRQVAATPAPGQAALEELLAGPAPFEANAGLTSAVPPGTRLLGLTIEDRVATVDLSEEYGSTGGGTLAEGLAVAQVVYTLTQFETVRGVLFELEGEPLDMTPGHGIMLEGPQTRADWKRDLPPILVTTPRMGGAVSSPVTVTGSADVFEATLQMRLLDAQGRRLARAFTTATCGTGCRGTFSHDLSFSAAGRQQGVVEVWWSSPEDGSRRDVVKIPVTLVP